METPEKLQLQRYMTEHPVINVMEITQRLVAAVTPGNAPFRPNDKLFDLQNPQEECYAIVKALVNYAFLVPARDSVNLFNNSADANSYGWIYLSILGSADSEFFLKMKRTPGAQKAFQAKMVSIMQAGVTKNVDKSTMCELGYILGYWLAKLYNNSQDEICDDDLPRELVIAKEHFMELNGCEYDDPIIYGD